MLLFAAVAVDVVVVVTVVVAATVIVTVCFFFSNLRDKVNKTGSQKFSRFVWKISQISNTNIPLIPLAPPPPLDLVV